MSTQFVQSISVKHVISSVTLTVILLFVMCPSLSAVTLKPSQQPAATNKALPKEELKTAEEFLNRYKASQHVRPEDNKIGFTIEDISKEAGGGITIRWKSALDVIMKSPQNQAYLVSLLYFIDPEDFSNFFTAGGRGEMKMEYKKGEELGKLDNITISLDKPSKFFIIYFKGSADAQFHTSPMFFMAELGDKPKLLDKSPRYAADLFKKIVEQSAKSGTR